MLSTQGGPGNKTESARLSSLAFQPFRAYFWPSVMNPLAPTISDVYQSHLSVKISVITSISIFIHHHSLQRIVHELFICWCVGAEESLRFSTVSIRTPVNSVLPDIWGDLKLHIHCFHPLSWMSAFYIAFLSYLCSPWLSDSLEHLLNLKKIYLITLLSLLVSQ